MDISRRWFLGGTLGVAAAAVMPLWSKYDAVLYADGVHDDTAALQAFFDGKPVYVKNDAVVLKSSNGEISLKGGSYKISRTLYLPKGPSSFKNLSIDMSEIPENGYLFSSSLHRPPIAATFPNRP